MAVSAVVLTYRHLSDFGRVLRSVEDGLVPILREVSGFRYHAIRCGESAGVSVTLFASDEAAQAGPHGCGRIRPTLRRPPAGDRDRRGDRRRRALSALRAGAGARGGAPPGAV